jgi:hypothetical protein
VEGSGCSLIWGTIYLGICLEWLRKTAKTSQYSWSPGRHLNPASPEGLTWWMDARGKKQWTQDTQTVTSTGGTWCCYPSSSAHAHVSLWLQRSRVVSSHHPDIGRDPNTVQAGAVTTSEKGPFECTSPLILCGMKMFFSCFEYVLPWLPSIRSYTCRSSAYKHRFYEAGSNETVHSGDSICIPERGRLWNSVAYIGIDFITTIKCSS